MRHRNRGTVPELCWFTKLKELEHTLHMRLIRHRARGGQAPRCAAVRRAHRLARYSTGRVVLEVLEQVNHELGTITAVITNNAAIAGMADRVIRISSGTIVEIRGQRGQGSTVGDFLVKSLGKVLWRDLWHLRGQVLAAALVVACGVMAQVSMRSAYLSLQGARATYYDGYRFAQPVSSARRRAWPMRSARCPVWRRCARAWWRM